MVPDPDAFPGGEIRKAKRANETTRTPNQVRQTKSFEYFLFSGEWMALNFREYQERFDELREDKADVVAYLKRTLMYR